MLFGRNLWQNRDIFGGSNKFSCQISLGVNGLIYRLLFCADVRSDAKTHNHPIADKCTPPNRYLLTDAPRPGANRDCVAHAQCASLPNRPGFNDYIARRNDDLLAAKRPPGGLLSRVRGELLRRERRPTPDANFAASFARRMPNWKSYAGISPQRADQAATCFGCSQRRTAETRWGKVRRRTATISRKKAHWKFCWR